MVLVESQSGTNPDVSKETANSLAAVAKAAGVSAATVSRVLNSIPGVKSETQEKVRAALAAMNYKPLRSRRERPLGTARIPSRFLRTGNIAAITLGTTRNWLVQYPVMAAALAGMQSAADGYGLRMVLHEMPDPTRISSLITDREIDGAVVFITSSLLMGSDYEKPLALLRSHLPVVWALGVGVVSATVDHVTVDNLRIGVMALDYLAGEKCGELAFLTLQPEWTALRLRAHAFLTAAHDKNIPATAYVLCSDPKIAEPYGRHVVTAAEPEQLIARMAAAKPRPTGLFVATDAMAAEAWSMLDRHGFHPGRNLTVISCDNEEVRLSGLFPRPASIDPGSEQIGYRAVIRLVARIQHSTEPPLTILTSPRLVLPSDATNSAHR